MRRALAPLLATLLAFAPALRSARADEPPAAQAAPSDPHAAAKEHYERGKTLQDAHSYAEAIAEYQAGYALVPTPGSLFNIAQCYRLQGDKRHAVEYYRRYLDAMPKGQGAADAREHILELTREIDAEPPAPTPALPAAAVLTPASPALDRPPAKPRRPLGRWQWTGIAAGGTGVAAGIVAAYFGIRSYQLTNEVNDGLAMQGSWSQDLTDKYNDGQRDEKLGIGFGIGAGVLIAGGVLAYFYGPRPEAPRIRVAPSASPGSAALLFEASF